METFNQNQENAPFRPNNNMPLAIIGMILGLCSPCCIGFIVGIVGVVLATQVNTKYNAGDYAGAESSAKNARILSFVAIGLGAIGLIIAAIQLATYGVDGMMQQYQEMIGQ